MASETGGWLRTLMGVLCGRAATSLTELTAKHVDATEAHGLSASAIQAFWMRLQANTAMTATSGSISREARKHSKDQLLVALKYCSSPN